jgi:hypothetical protein
MLRADKGNALAAHAISHRTGLVETEQFVSIVDKQVKVSKKTLTENPANARIGGLNLSKVLDYGG